MTTSPITTTTDTAALIEAYVDARMEPTSYPLSDDEQARIDTLFAQLRDRLTTPDPEPDPLLDDLARLLNDPRLPDMLAESVRAQLGETVYQLRVIVGEVAA